MAVKKDWEVWQINIKNAYLYGDLNEEIFMEAPQGYNVPDGHVLLLKKAPYGLKQAGRQWYLMLKEQMAKFGLKQVKSEPHTFVVQVVNEKRCTLIIPVYVDDLFPIGDKVLTDEFEAWPPAYFDITPPVDTHFFLGIQMIRNHDHFVFENGTTNCYIALDQGTFVDSVLERLTITLKNFDSPMASVSNLLPNPNPKEDTDLATVRSYQSAIGSLMYIMLGTRPDLAFAVQKLPSFSSNPSANHHRAIAHIFGYVNKMRHTSLVYCMNGNAISKWPFGFCHADWANRKGKENKQHSISGNVFFL